MQISFFWPPDLVPVHIPNWLGNSPRSGFSRLQEASLDHLSLNGVHCSVSLFGNFGTTEIITRKKAEPYPNKQRAELWHDYRCCLAAGWISFLFVGSRCYFSHNLQFGFLVLVATIAYCSLFNIAAVILKVFFWGF